MARLLLWREFDIAFVGHTKVVADDVALLDINCEEAEVRGIE